MTRVGRYLLRELTGPFFFALLLFASLAVFSGILPALQWAQRVPLLELLPWIFWQYPFYLLQTLPIALLLAVLLTYGRLAEQRELLALLAGGVPYARMVLPALLLGATCAVGGLFVNELVLPHASTRTTTLWWRLTTNSSGLHRLAGQTMQIGPYQLSFERTARRRDEMLEVRLQRWNGSQLEVTFAARGRYRGNRLTLDQVDRWSLDLAALDAPPDATAFAVLERLLRERERQEQLELTLPLTFEQTLTRYSGASFDPGLSLRELLAVSRTADTAQERRRAALVLNRKLVELLANLTMLLLAVPLAIRYATSPMLAFGLALLVTLGWYLLLAFGQLLAQNDVLPLGVALWSAQGVLVLLGGGLLLGLRRGR